MNTMSLMNTSFRCTSEYPTGVMLENLPANTPLSIAHFSVQNAQKTVRFFFPVKDNLLIFNLNSTGAKFAFL